MLCFLALVLPVALARPQGGFLPTTTSTTTQSPQASLLGLSASADSVIERAIDIGFSCANRRLGYYADVVNDCKVFHICNPVNLPDGQQAVMQYSFFCPANSFFDQQAMTCVKEVSIPCGHSERYYHNNDQIGVTDVAGIRRQQPQVATPVPVHQQQQQPLQQHQPLQQQQPLQQHQPLQQQQQFYPQLPHSNVVQQPNSFIPSYPQQQVFPQNFNQPQTIPQPQNFIPQAQNLVHSVFPQVAPSHNVVRAG